MQIQNVSLSQNNYSQKHNPNFTAIRSIKCEGLYKKYPEYANHLVEAFKKNPIAIEFCKKYDVDIVFHAVKQMQDAVESSIHIFFDNISKSKVRKFFNKLAGNNDDKIVLHAWANNYSLSRNMEQSTQKLVEYISPERKVGDHYRGGMLDSHIKSADERMQKVINEKSKKKQDKYVQAQAAKASKSSLDEKQSRLQDSINDLIEKGQ